MFVGIIQFPKIKDGREDDFLKWFEWSNSEFTKFDGFLSRKLLKSANIENSYIAILELTDEDTYRNIHQSKIHQMMFSRLVELLEGVPRKSFYKLAVVLKYDQNKTCV